MKTVVPRDSAECTEVNQVEGRALSAPAIVRVLGEGRQMLTLEVTMPAGQGSPPHVHDHESVGYVVRGKVRMRVGDTVRELCAGDGFVHPAGVEHEISAVAHEAVWLEVKSPPARTWE